MEIKDRGADAPLTARRLVRKARRRYTSGFRPLGTPPIFGVGDPLRNPEDDPLGTPPVDLFGTRLGYVTGAVTETSPVTFAVTSLVLP